MSIGRWLDLMYAHRGIRLSLKRMHATTRINPEGVTLNKISQTQDKFYIIPIIWGPWNTHTERDESRMVVARDGGMGMGGAENIALLFNEYRALDWGERKVLGMDSDDGCTIMWMHLIPMGCVLNMGKIVNFMLCIFYDN